MDKEQGYKIPASDFTKEMHKEAMSEGWLLSERSDGYLEIQCYDDDPKHRFEGDNAALDYVVSRAREGSYLHMIALHLDGTLGED